MNQSSVVITTPGYGGFHNTRTILDFYNACTQDEESRWHIYHVEPRSSLLTLNFNAGWATALTLREQPVIGPLYFLLLHSDIVAKRPDWFHTLLKEMSLHKADILSAVVPIKDQRGLTSTARDTALWAPVRYTLTETHALPETFTSPDLLLNTGMMLVNMRAGLPWNQICFSMQDTILYDETEKKYVARIAPEDWEFSRKARGIGANLYATRAVPVSHFGEQKFDSDVVWGQAVDTGNLERKGP